MREHHAALGHPELYTHPAAFSTVASRLYAPSLHPGNNLLSFLPVTYRRLRPALHPPRLTVIRGPLSHSGAPRSCDTRGYASLKLIWMAFNTMYVISACSLLNVQKYYQWDTLKRWQLQAAWRDQTGYNISILQSYGALVRGLICILPRCSSNEVSKLFKTNIKVPHHYLLCLTNFTDLRAVCFPSSSTFDKAFQLWLQVNFRPHLNPEKLIALTNESFCKSSPETGSLLSKWHNGVMRLGWCFKYNRREILNAFGKCFLENGADLPPWSEWPVGL